MKNPLASYRIEAASNQVRIQRARGSDREAIRDLYRKGLNPHARRIRIQDYFVARVPRKVIGCAAVCEVGNTGFLYGRFVDREWRCRGIGTSLTLERLRWLRSHGVTKAVGLVMFWNAASFRRLGFHTVPRDSLPHTIQRLRDFKDLRNRHSAAMVIKL